MGILSVVMFPASMIFGFLAQCVIEDKIENSRLEKHYKKELEEYLELRKNGDL
jgi:hypothetical protein